MSAPCTAQNFRKAMGAAVSGVSVVTTDGPSGRFGVTVSSLTSISLAPPTLMVSIQTCSPALGAIIDNHGYAINILSAGQDSISDVFAGRGPDGARHDFQFGDWRTGRNGAPLLRDCVASLECSVWRTMNMHDHTLIFGIVDMSAMTMESTGAVPLTFWRGAYGRPHRGNGPETHEPQRAAQGIRS